MALSRMQSSFASDSISTTSSVGRSLSGSAASTYTCCGLMVRPSGRVIVSPAFSLPISGPRGTFSAITLKTSTLGSGV